jgi:hypothetical protein
MPVTRAGIETFISDKITKVTECNAADLSAEFADSRHWLGDFVLVVILNNRLPEKTRPLALQFLRRIEAAFSEYARGRGELLSLVTGSGGRWSSYFRALYHFEATIAQLYMAYDNGLRALRTYVRATPEKGGAKDMKQFKRGDGSMLDRLNCIYDESKHAIPFGKKVVSRDQVVWITNSGIESAGGLVTFAELEEQLREYGGMARAILGGKFPATS